VRGGRVVAQGTLEDLMAAPESTTGHYLRHPLAHPLQPRRPIAKDTPMITVKGASLHNLRHVTAHFPIGRLSVVTGVSGSGKSTLAREVLLDNLSTAIARAARSRGMAAMTSRAGMRWIACLRLIRHLSAKHRALARRPISVFGMMCASSLPRPTRRVFVAGALDDSPSIRAMVAARYARDKVCAHWR